MLKFTSEELIESIKNSFSLAEVIRKLGGNPSGGIYPRIKRLIKQYNLDTSHFTGKSWSKGKNSLTDERIIRANKDIFIEKSLASRCYVKKLIIDNNLIDYKCSRCELITWQNEEISLELEHKNGIRNDNRLENLTFLCPNCHSLTPTFRNKNIKRKPYISEQEILETAKKVKNIRQILVSLNLSDGFNYRRIREILERNNFVFSNAPMVKQLDTPDLDSGAK